MCLSLSLTLSFFWSDHVFSSLQSNVKCLEDVSVCSKKKTHWMTQSVSEWQSHVLSCPQTVSGQLKNYFWLTKSLSKRVKACQMHIVGSERRLHVNVCSWGSTLWWGHSIKPLSPTLSPGTQKAPENIVQKNQPRETCHSQYSAFWMAKVIKFQRMKVSPTAG